jgi:hypothetical protein
MSTRAKKKKKTERIDHHDQSQFFKFFFKISISASADSHFNLHIRLRHAHIASRVGKPIKQTNKQTNKQKILFFFCFVLLLCVSFSFVDSFCQWQRRRVLGLIAIH